MIFEDCNYTIANKAMFNAVFKAREYLSHYNKKGEKLTRKQRDDAIRNAIARYGDRFNVKKVGDDSISYHLDRVGIFYPYERKREKMWNEMQAKQGMPNLFDATSMQLSSMEQVYLEDLKSRITITEVPCELPKEVSVQSKPKLHYIYTIDKVKDNPLMMSMLDECDFIERTTTHIQFPARYSSLEEVINETLGDTGEFKVSFDKDE